jgi:NAD(P)-dependent dehydrogenase (short-subunit alcohol dehydrogenase family)
MTSQPSPKKTILITGAGSGFGEAAAIGMARNGHDVIATVQVSPQVTPLREKAKALGLDYRARRKAVGVVPVTLRKAAANEDGVS